jgi:hypothetical protein
LRIQIYQNSNRQVADLTKSTDLLTVFRSKVRLQNLLLYKSASFLPFEEPEDTLPCSVDTQSNFILNQINPVHVVALFLCNFLFNFRRIYE